MTLDAKSVGPTWFESMRTLVLYVLAGVIGWVGFSITQQTKSIADQSTELVKLQVQVDGMQRENQGVASQLQALPVLSREVDKIQLQVDGHERRITELEQVKRLK